MHKGNKAILISFFGSMIPGLGQFYLNRFRSGVAFLLVATLITVGADHLISIWIDQNEYEYKTEIGYLITLKHFEELYIYGELPPQFTIYENLMYLNVVIGIISFGHVVYLVKIKKVIK